MVVLLSNPNKPTETVYRGEQLRVVARFFCIRGLFLIAGEIYWLRSRGQS